jgi:hypothetical protein
VRRSPIRTSVFALLCGATVVLSTACDPRAVVPEVTGAAAPAAPSSAAPARPTPSATTSAAPSSSAPTSVPAMPTTPVLPSSSSAAPTTPPVGAPTTSRPSPTSSAAPDAEIPAAPGDFPTPASTGPRVPESALRASGTVESQYDGQVIEGLDIVGNVRISHDDVVVRDSRVRFTSTYGLHVRKAADGSCPENVRFEYVEVDGSRAADSDIPVYGGSCGWTLDHAHVHDTGRAVRVVNDVVVSNSYIRTNRTGSDAHRGAVGSNGGRNNAIIGNVLICEGTGCSAAVPMYGDFAPVSGILVQDNLIATTGGYCVYGGSVNSKEYPDGSGVRFIGNRFSTRFFDSCGRFGVIAGFERGVRGNEFTGNVWHETGESIGVG